MTLTSIITCQQPVIIQFGSDMISFISPKSNTKQANSSHYCYFNLCCDADVVCSMIFVIQVRD